MLFIMRRNSLKDADRRRAIHMPLIRVSCFKKLKLCVQYADAGVDISFSAQCPEILASTLTEATGSTGGGLWCEAKSRFGIWIVKLKEMVGMLVRFLL